MNLIGIAVIHKNYGNISGYGKGIVVKYENNILYVRFADQIRKFSCPDLKTFLKYFNAEDPMVQANLVETAKESPKEKDEEIKKQRAAWEAKKERETLERLKLEDAQKPERKLKSDSEKESGSSVEYTADSLHITDPSLYSRAIAILKKLYGSGAEFRPGQYEAIERTIKEKRLLVVQKTGWGKSLVYFICTKLLREKGAGVCLVISPLLALIDNQLNAAKQMGLTCAALNPSTSAQKESILRRMEQDEYDLVLATPESFRNKKVRDYLPDIRIGLLVIDEAHCISDWGHDFRLEYGKIYRIIQQLQPNVPVLATTATANDAVIEDLTEQMGTAGISRGHLMRENLSIQVLNLPDKKSRYAWILDNIRLLSGTGIIYCLSRKDCTYLSEFLRENGVSAEPYFSGDQKQAEKNPAVLRRFINDEIKVIVSTIKLGMGFDKGNVGFIIHFQCPKNVIAYYQQIGRAGRSISFAKTFLMLGDEDYRINKSFIDHAFPSESDMREIREYITVHPYTTINKICADIDISKKNLNKVLMFLEDSGLIETEWRVSSNGKPYARYTSTAATFQYRGEHYERLKNVRYRELEQMQHIARTDKCLSRTVVSCLDDIEDHDCGICGNCAPDSRLPQEVSPQSRKTAADFLNDLVIPIEPWSFWPRNSRISDQKNYHPNLQGIALSGYNDGIGQLVAEGKYHTHRFDDILVSKGARILKKYIRKYGLTCVTAVPSLNTDIVPDYAERLAEACGLPYVPLLRKTNRSHQKELKNTSHQFVNACRSFEVLGSVDIPEGLILVDDIVDSGLTLAVCGAMLGGHGCKRVFPMALADAGTGGKDSEEDDE